MANPPDKQQRCVCGAVVHPDMYTICTRCKRNIVPQLADEALTSKKEIPTFSGRLYTYEHERGLAGNWCRRAEVGTLLEEIERLRAGWQWLAESADPNKLTGLFVVAHAKRMLSGDSSAPEAQKPLNLIGRLRALADGYPTAGEAADEIERLRAAFVAVRAKLAEYLERLLQGRTLPNRWVGEINDIVGDAISGDSSAPETSSQPTFVYAGNVFGTDDEGDTLVEWSNQKHKPEVGTLLFMRLWTNAEIEAAHKAGEELYRGLTQETSVPLTPAEMSTVARMAAVSAQVQQPEKAPAPHSLVAMYCGCLCSWCNEERAKLAENGKGEV